MTFSCTYSKLLQKANKTPQNYTHVHATVKVKNEFSTAGFLSHVLQQSAIWKRALTSMNLFYLYPIVTEDRIISIGFKLIISSAHQVGVLYTNLIQSIEWHDVFLGITPNVK